MASGKGGICNAVPARVSLLLLTAAGVMVLYIVRVNLSVAIVAMSYTPTADSSSGASTKAFCWRNETVSSGPSSAESPTEESVYNGTDAELNNTSPTSDKMMLTGAQKGLVLGAFFYGYFITNIPGGRLAEMYGTKRVFGGAILVGGLLDLLTPVAARIHFGVLIGLRTLIGLSHGMVYPALNVMVAKWIPPLERPRFISFTYMANCLGTIVALPMCGLIIAEVGWPTVFYVSGSMSLVWVVFWMTLMHDTPEEHPRISPEEREYIVNAVKAGTSARNKPTKTPWKSFMLSVPLWATNLAHVGSMFGFNLLLTQLPTYMSSVLGFSIRSNGFLSSLPFLTQFLASVSCGVLGDWLLTRKYITVSTSRKMFAFVSHIMTAIVLVTVGYVGCNAALAVALFPVATAFSGAYCSGHMPNHLDLSPNFAGTILGVGNSLAFMVSMCVPVIVGAMTPDQSLQQWQSVFWVTAAVYAATWLIFATFASTEIQPWNFAEDEEKTDMESQKFLEAEKKVEIVRNGNADTKEVS
ncbi:sialin-like [Penaeus monodon]|uniref:sialin-like n=1 Tax=Penaeus monodon TaxID=6687 RepID=UPI0018A7CCE7|nr:sialin-like [Penaeus monodon]